LKDLEDFNPNVSIDLRHFHLQKYTHGLGGPVGFASHLQEQRTSNWGDLEKELASRDLRSLRTHSTAKSEGEGQQPGEATEESVKRWEVGNHDRRQSLYRCGSEGRGLGRLKPAKFGVLEHQCG
jgi:hypothetical protein